MPLGVTALSPAAEQQEIGGSDGGQDAPATLSWQQQNMVVDLNAWILKLTGTGAWISIIL